MGDHRGRWLIVALLIYNSLRGSFEDSSSGTPRAQLKLARPRANTAPKPHGRADNHLRKTGQESCNGPDLYEGVLRTRGGTRISRSRRR